MAAFDDWVTDSGITEATVRQFVAEPERTGQPFRDGLLVCTSSGTTGHPGIHVSGRRDDVLRFDLADGRQVSIAPLAIGGVVEDVTGVVRCQLVQEGATAIRLRLAGATDVDAEATWAEAIDRLSLYLSAQGAAEVEIGRAPEPPETVPHRGKFRQVIGRRAI